MKAKWVIFGFIIVLYLLGIIGLVWHTFGSTNSSETSSFIEIAKLTFIALGGLGVILPTYLNVWQSLETAELLQDQVRRSKIENTFQLLQKWDDKTLFEARAFTRQQKKLINSLSADDLKKEISSNEDLER